MRQWRRYRLVDSEIQRVYGEKAKQMPTWKSPRWVALTFHKGKAPGMVLAEQTESRGQSPVQDSEAALPSPARAMAAAMDAGCKPEASVLSKSPRMSGRNSRCSPAPQPLSRSHLNLSLFTPAKPGSCVWRAKSCWKSCLARAAI